MSKDKIRVLITAGGSGIGHAIARAFESEGAMIWVTDIKPDILDSCPKNWNASKVDAADEIQVRDLFADLQNQWGGLDVVCSNAGIAGPTALIEDISLKDWQRCVSVNLEGAFLSAKYSIPMMKKQEKGVITLISSTAGLYGFPYRAPYASAKWGMLGFMKTLAMELGPHGIRANAICPGAVEGSRMERVIKREATAKNMSEEAVRSGYVSGTSMQSFVSSSDIANMAVFLSSPKAQYVTGQVIAVDGHTVNPDPQI